MKKETTSNGISRSINVSQSDIDNFKLQSHLVDLLWDEPFYSRILRSLNKIETEEIPTAGVLCKDGEITMWWNRRFLASLPKNKVKGLIKHECLHLAFKHTTDRRNSPHIIWNYATDLAINSIIPYDELPKGGLVPGYHLEPLTNDDMENMTKENIDMFNVLSSLIASFPQNKTSEYYFEKLMQNETIKEHAEKSSSFLSDGFPDVGFDDHEGWDEMSAEAREMMKEKLGEILKSAVEESNQKGWGSISSQVAITLNKMISKTIKWEDVLKRFCGFTRRDDRQSSTKRLNRKYPAIHPGSKKIYKPRIAVYVDESGSMPASILENFYGELNSLSSRTDFYMYKFDAVVDDKSGFLWKKGKRLKIERTMHGGTSFQSVTKHAIKNKKNFDGYIIFTDGCAPKPSPSHGLKRCWLLMPNCELSFKKNNSDILIQMKS
jgi:predicted metal-dependent peptidase